MLQCLRSTYYVSDSIIEKDYSSAVLNSVPVIIDEGLKLTERGLIRLGKNSARIAGTVLPVVGGAASIALGIKFASDRAEDGEIIKAGLEFASGVMGAIPVVGTVTSFSIDVSLFALDISGVKI